ncbi:MAG: GDP-mannose mannosyl hydrolase [Rhodanobacter sp.]|jgi:colanic acid biosynthesis protein WcaH|uniref:GDP-mannose mannosyl hydrolase n=1 Tax=Pseudomonas veronii TaxID=76761 RepID=A0A7Y1A9Y0_PSEVE|nr:MULTISPECIES: GDP-mannose mannosyl hydrolase [Pseudomonas]MBI6554754.1 GDP-mannose mannosyl hydrolase [Pseudomonas veronii]MBI6650831.1 GDP-mannose mannosyl hydrolase [Pseudomonas veronii]MBJ2179931.1 GDP-mannose mannosyl hydrolase [Pseudomonas veronii]MDY7552696.1 GDP-mannose mannosyl hydrolase [Pseudomonas sp. FG1]MEB0049988.1 GDP-mannose mannosyl hydrolase [Pseudomonas sp. FG1]
MWLDLPTFNTVVMSTPLVAIDLIVRKPNGDTLLGLRINRPAYGFWFVPGGRIQKNETLDDAFRRLTHEELGHTFERADAQLLGVFEHFYDDSVFANAGNGPDTHYVVLGYCLTLAENQVLEPPTEQHRHYRWWPLDELRYSPRVHENTRAYF